MPAWGRTHLFSDVTGLTKCLFLELKTKRKKSEVVKTQTTLGKALVHSIVCTANYQKSCLFKDVNFYVLIAKVLLRLGV
ncbi:hypothetical protein HanXRQr2_Chr01g0012401 [Helianthus annuus]|uniref:Uncharacterized protein n=1 Tax=Helianthus annuus TaxID=4232 RepID=A0A251VLV4_HELAN|nr:hypothetical protein HanXRQr2_Chr01g0012401 [Helianthus annuus]